MKQLNLLKTMFLLCALIVGSNAWADVVTFDATMDVDETAQSYQTTEKTYTATDGSTWKANGYGATENTNLVIGKGGANYLLTPDVPGTISSVAVTWSGNASYYLALQTTDGKTELEAIRNSTTSSTQTFTVSGSYSQLKLVGRRSSGTSNAAATITKVVVTYTPSSGPITYSVIYDGNGATSGTAPTDETAYSSGASVTVKGNTGGLEKTSFSFDGWNTKSDGTGTDYSEDDIFNITANTILYAKWTFFVTDGVFDFVNAAGAGEDYKSGISITNDGSHYETSNATWTAGNVTMVTSGKYRWWYNGNDLRFYAKDPASAAEFSVPDGYVITKIVTSGGSFSSADNGSLVGATWTGASKSVILSRATTGSSVNLTKITVTYTTANQPVTITCAGGVASFASEYALDLANMPEGLTAYKATAAGDGKVTLEKVEVAVPAGTGLILRGTPNETYNIPVAATASALDDNLLVGVTAAAGVAVEANTAYALSKTDGKFHILGAMTIPQGKAYLPATNLSARELVLNFGEGETTAISEVRGLKADVRGEYYNLKGQRVVQPTKGLYIVNGKKVVIK